MFWKRKQPKEKVVLKEPSPTDIIRNQIEQLDRGQTLSYQLSESRGGSIAIIELNPRYPERKQKKYIVWEQKMEGSKPIGKRTQFLDLDELKMVAHWIEGMGGKLVSEPGSESVDPV